MTVTGLSSLRRWPLTNLLLALLTEVGVVPLQPVALDKLLERLFQGLGLDGQREGEEGLLLLKGVVTPPADLLVQEGTAERLLEDRIVAGFLLGREDGSYPHDSPQHYVKTSLSLSLLTRVLASNRSVTSLVPRSAPFSVTRTVSCDLPLCNRKKVAGLGTRLYIVCSHTTTGSLTLPSAAHPPGRSGYRRSQTHPVVRREKPVWQCRTTGVVKSTLELIQTNDSISG